MVNTVRIVSNRDSCNEVLELQVRSDSALAERRLENQLKAAGMTLGLVTPAYGGQIWSCNTDPGMLVNGACLRQVEVAAESAGYQLIPN